MEQKTINSMALPEPPETLPVETPDTELSRLITDDDPETRLARLEKVAELAPRFESAVRSILLSATFPQDWERFGDGDKAKACLSSAGAERVGKHFPIRFFEVSGRKEDWTDSVGRAYRYIYEGKATLGDRVVFAQGNYSTRDAFLGKAGGKYRPVEEINEGSIRNAAYHIFCGNAIKALLGLRGLPIAEFDRYMNRTGQDAKKAGGHTYGRGTNGGTEPDDVKKQQRLAELCLSFVDAGTAPATDDGGKSFFLEPADDIGDRTEAAKAASRTLSTFVGKDGKAVIGQTPKNLKGRRLAITLDKAEKLAGTLPDLRC